MDCFDAEKLLCQIIDRVREDKSEQEDAADVVKEDDLAAKQKAIEREKLMVGMLVMTQKIFGNAEPTMTERIVR